MSMRCVYAGSGIAIACVAMLILAAIWGMPLVMAKMAGTGIVCGVLLSIYGLWVEEGGS